MVDIDIFPHYIHQIFINEDDTIPDFPLFIQENIRSVKVWYPEAKYQLWNRLELEAFIGQNFAPEVLKAFQMLKPFAYKADLARYCLLYIFGGLYIDVGLRLLKPINPPTEYGLIAFQDVQNSTCLWVSVINGLIWAKPKRNEFLIAVNMIVENCRNRWYGEDWLCPTGPALFGWAIVKEMANKSMLVRDDFWIGYIKLIGGDKATFITPTKNMVAYKPQNITSGEQKKLLKTNNYGEIWKNRQIYGEKEIVFDVKENVIKISPYANFNGNYLVALENNALLCYGPYICLNKGKYQFEIIKSENATGHVNIEITANCGQKVISFQRLDISKVNEVTLIFEIQENERELEFRIYSTENTKINILGYKITEIE